MAVDMELEAVLRAPEIYQAPYPPKAITLANGKKMVVREASREDVPVLLDAVRPTLKIARKLCELISWISITR